LPEAVACVGGLRFQLAFAILFVAVAACCMRVVAIIYPEFDPENSFFDRFDWFQF
jgi:hypothetical protein